MATPGIRRKGALYPTGWRDDHKAVDRVMGALPHPIFGVTARPIRDTGKGKVVLLYQANRKVTGRDFCHFQTIGDCFVAGTIVLGERTKPIEDVRIGDRIWTAQGRLTRVVSTRAIETLRPLVCIHSVGGLPTLCTADHLFLVYRLGRIAGKRVNAAYYQRAISDGPQGFSKGRVATLYEARCPEWVAAGDLRDTDCLLTPIRFARIVPPRHVPGNLWSTHRGRRLLGYFLGDGYAGGGSLEFSVSSVDVEVELVGTLRDAGFDPKVDPYRDDCGAWRVRVHNVEAVRWFRRHFYDVNKIKSFPGWAMGDNGFIAGLKLADGHDTADHHAIDSTSESIISATIFSLIQMGYEPTVNPISRRGAGVYPNAKPIWRIIWRDAKRKNYVWRDEEFVCRPVRRVEFVEGRSVVYDIGVADPHHSFLANTHGVHNCVSHGWSMLIDTLKCVQIVSGKRETFPGENATEVIYAGARVEVGMGQAGRGDGACGAWAAKCVTDYGTLVRGRYGDIDLSTYDGNRARAWGMPNQGIPDQLEAIVREHPIKTVSLVQSYEEARDAIVNGYPVAVCSNQGFGMQRDAEGFARPEGTWEHGMCFIAADDAYRRPGLLCMNSWGPDWIVGPKRNDQPDGSFWVDAETVNVMLAMNDSFVGSGYASYPAQVLDYDFLAAAWGGR